MARITPRSGEDFLNCLVTSAVISPSDTVFQPVPGGSLNLLSLIVMIGGIKLTEGWGRLSENTKLLLNVAIINLP